MTEVALGVITGVFAGDETCEYAMIDASSSVAVVSEADELGEAR